jgi:hypothetical protein
LKGLQANKYFFFRNDQKTEFYEFDPHNPTCLDQAGYKYFGRVLNCLEKLLPDRGLVIYVTAWTVHELPSYGPNVISCILQDEWGREPRYRDKVGMIFKTCGRSPITPEAYRYGGPADCLMNMLAQAKYVIKDGWGRPNTLLSIIQNKKIAPVFSIPLGFFAREDINFIPYNKRQIDLYFAGSINHKKGRGWQIKRPKELARQRMENALQNMSKSHPALKIQSTFTSGYAESVKTDNRSYLQHMMNTKICPIPRGANLETFRFYEAMRYGCIPVGEAFPNEWYYKNAPVLRLNNWSELVSVIPDFLNDLDRQEEMHQNALAWWKDICSESAIAQYMVDKMQAITT